MEEVLYRGSGPGEIKLKSTLENLRAYATLANALTVGSLTAGFVALLGVLEHDLARAAVLVTIAAALDALDGAAARRRGAREGGFGDGGFGAALDSLADLVSFGVVPAFAVHAVMPTGVGVAVALSFLICGALRLARFSISKHPGHFVGAPIPPSGVALTALCALVTSALVPPPVVVAATLVLAALMVSNLRVPTLGRMLRGKRVPVEPDPVKPEPAELRASTMPAENPET